MVIVGWGIFKWPSRKDFWSQSSLPTPLSFWLTWRGCGLAPGPGDKDHPGAWDLYRRPSSRGGVGASATSWNLQPQGGYRPGAARRRGGVQWESLQSWGTADKGYPAPEACPPRIHSPNRPGRYIFPSKIFPQWFISCLFMFGHRRESKCSTKEVSGIDSQKGGMQPPPGLRSEFRFPLVQSLYVLERAP